MNDFIDSREYKLTCISPVHIGSGDMFKAFEYIYDRRNRKVGFIQEEKWQKMLLRHNLLDAFLDLLKNTWAGKVNLLEWLRKHDVEEKEIWDTVKRTSLYKTDIYGDKNTLNDIHVASSLADGSLYIPGSSIKGALRTGIFYNMLQCRLRKEQAANKLCQAMDSGNVRKNLADFAARLERTFLSIKKDIGDEQNVELKCLSGLVVGDAHLIKPTSSIVLQKVDVTTGKKIHRIKPNPLSLFRECIPAGTEFSLRISVDRQLLSHCKVASVQEILDCCREYLQQGLAMQQGVFGAYYKAAFQEAQQADFTLGGGTGFLQKSIWYSLFPDENEANIKLRQLLDCFFRKHEHKLHDKQISPRTLKLAATGSQRQIMGLCRMEEVQDGRFASD